tara:strand:+ start:272 stop:454 length:183 start_codon:yes stop_codon:yes gene_type:complete
MNCWHCKSELIWDGDHSYEDHCIDGDGIVSNLSCSDDECGVETILVYYKIDEDNKSEEEE